MIELLPTAVSLGSIRISLVELNDAGPNSLISLGRLFSREQHAELLVAGMVRAHGKVVVVEEEMGIRITEVPGGDFA